MALNFSKIAGKNIAAPFKSGLVFWTGGLAAWIWHTGLASFYKWCLALKPIEISLYSFAILLAMAVSTILVQRSALPVLRFLEGYYFPERFRSLLLKNLESNIRKKKKRFNALYMKSQSDEQMTQKESEAFTTIEFELIRLPDKALRLPTRLGNILRFAEIRPKEKYGLNSFICFPRLWLILPSDAKKDLTKARNHLDTTAHIWSWSILFFCWAYFAIWAIPVGLVFAWLSYRWMLTAAAVYAQLIESAFDVYRQTLYEAIRWPLPKNPLDEYEQGQQLSIYLSRGSREPEPLFYNSEADD